MAGIWSTFSEYPNEYGAAIDEVAAQSHISKDLVIILEFELTAHQPSCWLVVVYNRIPQIIIVERLNAVRSCLRC